ncbi:TetR/AcrR family transcriptional regulator [Paraburkholderia acidipaludis]|uniref:TetR/AcrR family transcriptional regulator n=1 Tax=Paraburkholderia acidipaludis TaxID=660537 RepID=UPI0009FD30DF|nr:WHG domain-containing protein [Paraburkholderia acidipaludis]
MQKKIRAEGTAAARTSSTGNEPGGEPAPARRYHHGSLPDALLRAAETVLRRDGLRGLTLRAIAREAGVSHTAPQHHFGDTTGVLSELAATGHRRLAASMIERARGVEEDEARSRATARGYVDFAVNHPDLFRLMARNELLDAERPSLVEARRLSARELAGVAGSPPSSPAPDAFAELSGPQAVAMTALWAYVHGLASLLIDHRLTRIAAATDTFRDPQELVDAVIEQMGIVRRSVAASPPKADSTGRQATEEQAACKNA